MVRRYDDPVDVRRGAADEPQQFLWRGRLWKVRDVVAHWVETGPWWQTSGAQAALGHDVDVDLAETGPPGTAPAGRASAGSAPTGPASTRAVPVDLLAERELWRVEAGQGPSSIGVFDLSFDWSDGSWQLVGCLD